MRAPVKDFIKLISKHLNLLEPIYEFGSRQYDEKNDADIRGFFKGKIFIGCDINAGQGVDKVLDLHSIDLPDNSVNTILIIDVMEHVRYPFKAFDEIYRILKYDGVVIFSSVMDYQIHGAPCDYWRFTPHGFEVLLEKFKTKEIFYTGHDNYPHSLIGIGIKNAYTDLSSLKAASIEWRKKWDNDKYDYAVLQAKIHRLEEQLEVYKNKLDESFFTKVKKQFNRTFKYNDEK